MFIILDLGWDRLALTLCLLLINSFCFVTRVPCFGCVRREKINANHCSLVSDLFILLELEDDENSQSLRIESSLIQLKNRSPSLIK